MMRGGGDSQILCKDKEKSSRSDILIITVVHYFVFSLPNASSARVIVQDVAVVLPQQEVGRSGYFC